MAASRLITASRGLRSGCTSPFCAQAHFLALMSVGEHTRGCVRSCRRLQADVMGVVVADEVALARRSPCIVLAGCFDAWEQAEAKAVFCDRFMRHGSEKREPQSRSQAVALADARGRRQVGLATTTARLEAPSLPASFPDEGWAPDTRTRGCLLADESNVETWPYTRLMSL